MSEQITFHLRGLIVRVELHSPRAEVESPWYTAYARLPVGHPWADAERYADESSAYPALTYRGHLHDLEGTFVGIDAYGDKSETLGGMVDRIAEIVDLINGATL